MRKPKVRVREKEVKRKTIRRKVQGVGSEKEIEVRNGRRNKEGLKGEG